MSENETDMPDEGMLSDESVEHDFLPDLAERQETLRRANLALERARALLEQVRSIDTRSQKALNANPPPPDSIQSPK
jgi:hypothetical protein